MGPEIKDNKQVVEKQILQRLYICAEVSRHCAQQPRHSARRCAMEKTEERVSGLSSLGGGNGMDASMSTCTNNQQRGRGTLTK